MSNVYKHEHVEQLEDWRDGRGVTGNNNCAEASTARYLREAAYPFAGNDHELIAHVRLGMTGLVEYAGEGYTTSTQVAEYLTNLGVLVAEIWDNPELATHPWTILLVRGQELAPRQYPTNWFGADEPDHYILMLKDNLVNDPLAFYNGKTINGNFVAQDCVYTNVVQAARNGACFQLLDPYNLHWTQTGPGKFKASKGDPTPPPVRHGWIVTTIDRTASLRQAPHAGSAIQADIPARTQLFLAAGQDLAPWYAVDYHGRTLFISANAVTGTKQI